MRNFFLVFFAFLITESCNIFNSMNNKMNEALESMITSAVLMSQLLVESSKYIQEIEKTNEFYMHSIASQFIIRGKSYEICLDSINVEFQGDSIAIYEKVQIRDTLFSCKPVEMPFNQVLLLYDSLEIKIISKYLPFKLSANNNNTKFKCINSDFIFLANKCIKVNEFQICN